MILDRLGEPIKADLAATRSRAEKLVRLGFGIADAAHVAFAEQLGAQLITCDDRLVKKCLIHKNELPRRKQRGIKDHNGENPSPQGAGYSPGRKINVWCGDPVAFCEKEGLR